MGQLGPGGLERQLYSLLLAMDRARYRPTVAVWNHRADEIYARRLTALGVPVVSLDGASRRAKLRRLASLVKTLRPDVLHSYSFYTNFAAWWCTRGSPTIAVGSIRNNFLSDRRLAGRVLGRLCARWPADQICNSRCAQSAVHHTRGPFKPARLHVVTNRLDVAGFPVAHSLPDRPMLLAVGRLFPEKRWDRLIEAVAELRRLDLSFSVRLAGDGPLRPVLAAQAARLGVDDRLELLGTRHDVAHLLGQATCLVHTADEEGCPNVVMEAMACGRAVVATDAGDVPFLIEDGRNGFLVTRGDRQTLVHRLATLIKNPERCRVMGQAARITAERDFDLSLLNVHTLEAYRKAGWRA